MIDNKHYIETQFDFFLYVIIFILFFVCKRYSTLFVNIKNISTLSSTIAEVNIYIYKSYMTLKLSGSCIALLKEKEKRGQISIRTNNGWEVDLKNGSKKKYWLKLSLLKGIRLENELRLIH